MALPSFMVIGAAKSGTTALHSYLRQHPDVFLPLEQEPSWFSFAGEKLSFTGPGGLVPSVNQTAFTDRIEFEALYEPALPHQTKGDVSPVYLYWPGTAQRVAAEVPEAKMVALLRHPVDRAYSAFMHARREDREPIHDFEEALEAEPGRIADNCGFLWRYRDLGNYAPQLRRWLDAFPPEQLLVATYDEFVADTARFCQRVQAFIGVDSDFTPRTDVRYNASGIPRNRRLYGLLSSDSIVGRVVRAVTPAGGRDRLRRAQARVRSRILDRVPLEPGLRNHLIEEWYGDIQQIREVVDLDIDPWLEPAPAHNN